MPGYAKVFPGMYTGSMYGAGMHVFAVWGWVLAHKDENGLVEINPQLVANELGGVAQQVEEAITYLRSPDPHSRSPEHEGRRLIKVSQFGYQVVNAEKYRVQGGPRAEYWREWRAKQQQNGATGATVAQQPAQQCATSATHADADADADAGVSKKKLSPPDSDEFRLAKVLLDQICERKPDFKKPNLQTWAKHIDHMIRIDNRAPEQIETVIRWSQRDPFWRNNILSTEKLRQRFDQLELKMKGCKNDQSRRARLEDIDYGPCLDPTA